MAIKREKIQPQRIPVSMVDGKARYTQVVTVSGTGKMIFVAGQLARNTQGVCVGKGDMRAQIQQVGENITTCLEAGGATLADIVKTNTYLTDYAEFAKHPDMRMRYFGPRHADQHDDPDQPAGRPRRDDRDRSDRCHRRVKVAPFAASANGPEGEPS
jgi:2-iminobutanoate/2-iminopropanoate deaminase